MLPLVLRYGYVSGFIPVLLWYIIAAPTLHAQSLLWEIDHPEVAHKSYLFATLHDLGLDMQLPDYQLVGRLESVEVLALEQVSDWPGDRLINHAMLPDGQHLYRLLKRGQYRRTCRFFWHLGGIEADVLDDYNPVYLAVLAAQYRRREGVFLDWILRDMAHYRGIPVIGLESIREQMAALESLERRQQAALLDAMVQQRRRSQPDLERIQHYYLSAQLDSLALLLQEVPHPAFLPEVLQTRNGLLAQRIYDLCAGQSALVAIGAAHMGGEESLLDQLSALGIGLKALPAGAPTKPFIPAAEQVPDGEALKTGYLDP